MNPRRRRAPALGDVVEIATPRGLAYAQFSHAHPTHGELIRVLPGLYRERPSLPPIVAGPERFFVFYPLAAAVREDLVTIVGSEPVPPHARAFPTLKSRGGIDRSGRVLNWWLWDDKRERRVDELSEEEASLSSGSGWGHELLVKRIAENWSPADDVLRQERPIARDPGPPHSTDPPPTSPDHAVLQELEKAGADLSEPRSVRHYLYFSSRGAARRVGRVLRGRDFVVAVEAREEGSWVVLADHRPVLALEGIDRLRDELEALAAAHGGEYDGWEAAVSE